MPDAKRHLEDGTALVRRSVEPRQTVEWLSEVAQSVGVSRLAEVTMLDVIGIPVWQAIRPLSRNLTVSQGKGLTDDQAKAGALMESIEMFFAESPPLDEIASLSDMAPTLGYDLAALPSRQGERPAGGQPVEWSEGWFLEDRRPTFVPRDLLNLDFTRSELCHPWFLPTSNGLAGGNSMEEAVLHGLYEVVERHSLRLAAERGDAECHVNLNTFTSAALNSVISACQRAALSVEVEDVTSDLGIPCFKARLLSDDRTTEMFGSGAHWSAEAAALKALLEAVQSRLTVITGARDDIDEEDFYPRADYRPRSAGLRAGAVSRRAVPAAPAAEPAYEDAAAELNALMERLARFGHSPIVVELSRARGLYSVCFVVVPGLYL